MVASDGLLAGGPRERRRPRRADRRRHLGLVADTDGDHRRPSALGATNVWPDLALEPVAGERGAVDAQLTRNGPFGPTGTPTAPADERERTGRRRRSSPPSVRRDGTGLKLTTGSRCASLPGQTGAMVQLADIAPTFIEMAHRIVWCTAATVDQAGRPRTRILHPIWEFDGDRLAGWILTSPNSTKARHLAGTPELSLTYWIPSHDTCTADCTTTWEDSPEERAPAGSRFADGPAPVGYDPR